MICNTDSFFAIGKTHMVCEDYARSGRTEERHPYAIVCDGCSSSEDTDIGARALATSLAARVEDLCTGKYSTDRVMNDAAAHAGMALFAAKVEDRALDTTVIAAYRVEKEGKEGVQVSMRGDGVVVARLRSGEFFLYTVDHEHNAPRYLNYDRDSRRLEGYMRKFGDKAASRVYVSKFGNDRPKDGWVPELYVEFNGHPDDWFFDAAEYDLVMVLSDGVQTFQQMVTNGTSKNLVDIPVEEVVRHLLQIKGTKGEFLKRRCHKFLTRHCVTHNWQHYDDFSAAAIWMEDPNAD
jgi:serine/threonine protein phosphatase PrpC